MPDQPAIQGTTGSQGRAATLTRAVDVDDWQIVFSGSGEAAQYGLQREYEIADQVAALACKPTIYIWRSQCALIVARGQTRWPRYAAAAATLAEMGWPVLVRRSGGGAVPIGLGTVQVAMISRYPGFGSSMEAIYDRVWLLIASTLTDFGIAAHIGETPGAFCNGRHDLVVADRKIAGLAQHWRLSADGVRCVTAAASVLVDAEVSELAAIVNRFHVLCGQTIDIRPEAMTTVRDNCDTGAGLQGDLVLEFLTNLAAAAHRNIRSAYSDHAHNQA